MPSTNKTTGLELNQYVATDKPTMADYNADMLKIDAEVARTNTLLWQGTAEAGDTITVPNLTQYHLFTVTVVDNSMDIIATRTRLSSFFRGEGGGTTDIGNYRFYIGGSISGNEITITNISRERQSFSGGLTIDTDYQICQIWGII